MARKKTRVVPVPLESELPGIAKLCAEAQAKLKKIESEAEEKIAAIREKAKQDACKWEDQFSECSEQLEAYALKHQKAKFSKVRSMKLGSVTFGFRLGTPKVVKTTRDTWAVVTGKLKEHFPDFVRTKEEPNKDAIIEAREDAELMAKLSMLGVQVDQEDSVFIDVAEEALREQI